MNSEINKFVDILEARRRQNDAFGFMSRYWNPQKSYLMEKYCTPQELKDAVLNSLYMDTIIEAESIHSGVTKDNLKAQLVNILEEMGLDKKMYVVRWLGIFFIKTVLMMRTGVLVNERMVFKLKGELGKNPVIFLPTHRSYADFCLMTYLCFHYEIELPAVAAGMDFHSMAVLGRVMRDTCAFYIRRSLGGNPLYAATLRQYMRTLVTKHFAPLEFFVEGTRSRSNKSMQPKYGLISMALLPLFTGEVSDITIVPVNINYDRLMEHGLFTYEHLGVPKPKESTGAFLKALNILNDNFGNVYINIGKPFSAKQYFTSLPHNSETLKPKDLQQITPKQFELVQKLAQNVVALQQKYTIVANFNLIALILMTNLVHNQSLSKKDLLVSMEWITALLKSMQASVLDNDLEKDVDRLLVVHRAMVKFDKKWNLRLISTLPMMLNNDIKKKMKGHILKAESMVNAVPIIQLQLYVNPILHYFIPSAVVYVLVNSGITDKVQLFENYKTLRVLLKYEFFYVEEHESESYQSAINFCQENNVISSQENGHLTTGTNEKLINLLQTCIWPSLSSLDVCLQVFSEKKTLEHRESLRLIQEEVEKSSHLHPYCLSLELISNCIQSTALHGALRREKQESTITYSIVPEVAFEAHNLVRSVMPQFTGVFNHNNQVILDHKGILARL